MTIPALLPSMVLIPGGVFQGRTIDPFYLGRTPVTNEQYAEHADQYSKAPIVLLQALPDGRISITRGNDNRALTKELVQLVHSRPSQDLHLLGAFLLFRLKRELTGQPDRPVTKISWFHALEYCVSNGFALPSDDQWEYAARGSESHGCDMNSQVWEWTSRNPHQPKPFGLRGGAWSPDLSDDVRWARRWSRVPRYSSPLVGFRVAIDPSGRIS